MKSQHIKDFYFDLFSQVVKGGSGGSVAYPDKPYPDIS